jgi:hypothetical protein
MEAVPITSSHKQRATKEGRHPNSPKPKKIRAQPSAGKVLLTLFWKSKRADFGALHE